MNILDIYSPKRCFHCGKEITFEKKVIGGIVCEACDTILKKERLNGEGRCPRCFHPVRELPDGKGETKCPYCESRYVFFDSHTSLYAYSEPWKRVLHTWKFENERSVHRYFHGELRQILKNLINDHGDGRIFRFGFVDSGHSLYRTRNFSPVYDLCSSVSGEMGWKCFGDIKKVNRKKQSEKGFADRFFDVAESLTFRNRKWIAPESYILIEDLFTTGATVNESARRLKEMGAREVHVISMLFHEEDRNFV